jgi:hypothetical protein
MNGDLKDLRDWMFRAIMFEADAERFRSAGIRVGADTKLVESSLLEETLAPFPIELRNEALQMGRLYALLYCFENSVRSLIKEKLQEKRGADWWDKAVPDAIKKHAQQRQEDAEKETWLEGSKKEPLGFADFGQLASIIVQNWPEFEDLILSQHWLKQRMDELEKVRNFIAHNRLLLPGEFARIEMYVEDWNRQVGL